MQETTMSLFRSVLSKEIRRERRMENYSPGTADICQKGSSLTKPLPTFTVFTIRLKLHHKVFNQHPTGQERKKNPTAPAVFLFRAGFPLPFDAR